MALITNQVVSDQLALIRLLFAGKLSFIDFYTTSLPYTSTFIFGCALIIIVFVSCHTGKKNDFTLVDKIWPTITVSCTINYIIHGYLVFNQLNSRLLLLLAIQTCWTYHLMELFARRGGYSGVEDHRWAVVLRDLKDNQVQLILFSFAYVSFFQPLMLINNSLPELKLYDAGSVPLSPRDWFYLGLIAGLVGFEYLCDTYVQEYQVAKAIYLKDKTLTKDYTEQELQRGFCTRGPFAFSRHANFCTEQFIWLAHYLYGASFDSSWLNWTLVGPATFFLFVCSSAGFTEAISASRYPEYMVYREKVPFLLPLPWKRWTEAKA
ncbi:hypothetical protein BZA70DRAFT_310705 [Myxozyma melibiosi]|uniref:Steroid 5-alpha reductase C-terminal domain-containing protein n=1 Tax=Myxozyma melibiosi TaxID=54550 RepID=A0ABR1F6V2_9ASCO